MKPVLLLLALLSLAGLVWLARTDDHVGAPDLVGSGPVTAEGIDRARLTTPDLADEGAPRKPQAQTAQEESSAREGRRGHPEYGEHASMQDLSEELRHTCMTWAKEDWVDRQQEWEMGEATSESIPWMDLSGGRPVSQACVRAVEDALAEPGPSGPIEIADLGRYVVQTTMTAGDWTYVVDFRSADYPPRWRGAVDTYEQPWRSPFWPF